MVWIAQGEQWPSDSSAHQGERNLELKIKHWRKSIKDTQRKTWQKSEMLNRSEMVWITLEVNNGRLTAGLTWVSGESQPLTNWPRLPILDLLRSRSLLCPAPPPPSPASGGNPNDSRCGKSCLLALFWHATTPFQVDCTLPYTSAPLSHTRIGYLNS